MLDMSKEIARQYDMFTGELADTRTAAQKRQDKQREQPQQFLMFAQRDIAQFGVEAHPLLPLSDSTKLLLIPEDHRTPEEIDRDIQREAEARTTSLFCTALIPYVPPEKSLVVFAAPRMEPQEQNIVVDEELLLFCAAAVQGFAFSLL